MPNTCPLIITRGKNKGWACGDVNKKCRHRNSKCPKCGVKFTIETSYIRHQTNKCRPISSAKNKKERITITVKHQHTTEKSGPDPYQPIIPVQSQSKVKVTVDPDVSDVLLEKIERLQRELEEVKNQPSVHHHWNIVVGMNFFDELVQKMGKGHAIKYLSDIATEKKPLDVINKLYLEGTEPTSYPIACQDHNHFRYIDDQHRVIDDKGGHGISKIVSRGVRHALLLAANEANDCYNIAPIQSYAADMIPNDQVVNGLALMTSIPNHPFFTDDDAFKIESTLDDR
jgi:hypothetical protein